MPAGSTFADKGPSAFVPADSSLMPRSLARNHQQRSVQGASQHPDDFRLVPGRRFGSPLSPTFPPTTKPSSPLSPAAPGPSSADSTRRRRPLMPSSCRPCSRSKARTLAARGEAWAQRVRDHRASWPRSRPRSTSAASTSTASTRTDRRAITQGFGAGGEEAEGGWSRRGGRRGEAPTSPVDRGARRLGGRGGVWAASTSASRPGNGSTPEPEPFDPLPVCSPGMLTGDDGLPLEAPPAGLPDRLPRLGASSSMIPVHPHDLRPRSARSSRSSSAHPPMPSGREAAGLLDPRSTSCAPGSRSATSSSTCSATPRAGARRRSSGSSAPPPRATASGSMPTA